LGELPLVEMPSAMSPRSPNAMICREKIVSTPTSLASAVSTATSLVRAIAGSGRQCATGGARQSAAASCASVASAASTSWSRNSSASCRRSATTSRHFWSVEPRTSASRASVPAAPRAGAS
jgi:hypothetical protein